MNEGVKGKGQAYGADEGVCRPLQRACLLLGQCGNVAGFRQGRGVL